jgi:hypothetical protein
MKVTAMAKMATAIGDRRAEADEFIQHPGGRLIADLRLKW